MSEYLSDEEQLARLRDWWQRHGLALLAGVVVIVAAVVGWRWYQGQTAERIRAASDLYEQYQEAAGEDRDALARQIIEQGQGTAYPAFVLLRQADAAVAEGDATAAEAQLRRALELASGDEIRDTARIRLARVLFDLDRADEALTVLGAIRGAGFRSLAAELKGDIHLSRGERDLAHQSFVTARSYVPADEQRPVLEMKIADTAAPRDASSPASSNAASDSSEDTSGES